MTTTELTFYRDWRRHLMGQVAAIDKLLAEHEQAQATARAYVSPDSHLGGGGSGSGSAAGAAGIRPSETKVEKG